jgi:hypothetical protein
MLITPNFQYRWESFNCLLVQLSFKFWSPSHHTGHLILVPKVKQVFKVKIKIYIFPNPPPGWSMNVIICYQTIFAVCKFCQTWILIFNHIMRWSSPYCLIWWSLRPSLCGFSFQSKFWIHDLFPWPLIFGQYIFTESSFLMWILDMGLLCSF